MSAPQIQYPPTSGGGTPTGGSGTANTIPLWTGSTPSTTLTDSLLSQSGAIVTNSGTFRAADGSNTEPGYTFTNSSGSGMYRGTSGTVLRFASSGTFAFGVSSSQRVYIGTAATAVPTERLEVGGGIRVAGVANVATATASQPGVLSLEFPVTRIYTGDGTGYTFAISKRSGSVTTDMLSVVDNTGNVGIGTASPWGALTVARAAGSDAYAEFGGGGRTSAAATFIGQDAAGSAYLWNRTNQPVYFGTNNLTRAVVGSASLDISATAGYGLKLPATPGNGDRQTLDSYQELDKGVASYDWTPTVTFGTGGTVTYTVDQSSATRIGRMVFFFAQISYTVTAAPTGGDLSFTLPATGAGFNQTVGVGNANATAAGDAGPFFMVLGSSATSALVRTRSGTAANQLAARLTTSSTFTVSGAYQV